MGVHIHRAIGQDQVQGGQWVAFFRQQAVIGFLQGKGKQAALDPAAVDEKGHIGAVGPVQVGRAGKTGNAIVGFRVLAGYCQQRRRRFRPIHRQKNLGRPPVARRSQGLPVAEG